MTAATDRRLLDAVLGDPERLRALRSTMLLDSPTEEGFDRLARLAGRILDAPLATVTLIDRDRQFYKACVGMPEPLATTRETPHDMSFCRHTVHLGEPLVIPDTRADARVSTMISVTEHGVLAYAGVPLFVDGHAIGTICVMDLRPRDWTHAEIGALRDLAASVTTEIELRAAVRASAEVAERLRETTAEAQAARQEAEQANRAKARFLAAMSHDLRTPLNAIGGYAQLIELGARGPVTEEQRRDLMRIQASQAHLLHIINDLLAFARLEAGRVEYRLQSLASGATLASAAAMVEPLADSRGLALAIADDADDAGSAVADPDRALQILVNLLTNAVKFTPPGGRVTLAAARANDRVEWRVHDTGVGISADRLTTVFEPFVQGDPTTADDGTRDGHASGVGLGLAISRELARGMGGDVDARSEPGVGSTFTLRLPAAR